MAAADVTKRLDDGFGELAGVLAEYDAWMAERAREAARPKTDQPKVASPLIFRSTGVRAAAMCFTCALSA